ncbi:MAG: NAC family transcription factor [Methanomicrobium sp.]|nr:NAC family transcription factor [Methanomicrobium sp.]
MPDKDGDYCTICGGIVPAGNDIRQIIVDGKEVGINKLDFIFDEVKKLNLSSLHDIREEIIKRVCALNYVPTKKKDAYAEALMKEYGNK